MFPKVRCKLLAIVNIPSAEVEKPLLRYLRVVYINLYAKFCSSVIYSCRDLGGHTDIET